MVVVTSGWSLTRVVERRASTVSLLSPSLGEKEKVSAREAMVARGKRGKEASVEERPVRGEHSLIQAI